MAVSGEGRAYRPEVQGIRALAALLVAAFHLWLGRVSGGVDVFFVISGFLITTTLLGHFRRFGRIRPLYYLGRLARRLLPAALTVLVVVVVASWILLPSFSWARVSREVVASALYAENWRLAFDSVDYLAQFDDRTPVQHFWAMSVQGQFYVIWLVIFLVVAALVRRVARRETAVLAAFVVVGAASLVWSIIETAQNQPFAYFDTLARTWEFALGGIAAILLPRLVLGARLRWALGWIGVLGVVSCGLVLPVSTVFPGYAALWPTVSALLVLVAGTGPSLRASAVGVLGSRPLVWLGDLSYGLYLWHWPIMVLFLAVMGYSEVSLRSGLIILAVSIVAAWLTHRFIERPLQRSRPRVEVEVRGEAEASAQAAAPPAPAADRPATAARRRPTVLRPILTVLALVVVIGGSLGGEAVVAARAAQAQQSLDAVTAHPPTDDCWGAAALTSGADCAPVTGSAIVPQPILRDALINEPCESTRPEGYTQLRLCLLGSPREEASRVVVLTGDSHAQSIRAAVAGVAAERDWAVIDATDSGCLPSQAERLNRSVAVAEDCREWNRELVRWLGEQSDIDLLFTMAASGREVATFDGTPWQDTAVEGYLEQWRMIAPTVPQVVVLRDTPRLASTVAVCVDRAIARGSDAGADCARDREDALLVDPAALAAAGDDSEATLVVDLTDAVCGPERCEPVVGGIWAYRDNVHLTRTFSATLAPALGAALDAAGITS